MILKLFPITGNDFFAIDLGAGIELQLSSTESTCSLQHNV